LGATRTETTDARVVAATNRNLSSLVEDGTFRQDLYYRINVVPLRLPPLRERLEDLPLLVDHFIARLNRLKSREIGGVSPDVLATLMNHDFPGNIRELENIIEHAFVMCRSTTIRRRHLPPYLAAPSADVSLPSSLQEAERRFLEALLEKNDWNRAATARQLGIHKTTLWRKIKRLGIAPPDR